MTLDRWLMLGAILAVPFGIAYEHGVGRWIRWSGRVAERLMPLSEREFAGFASKAHELAKRVDSRELGGAVSLMRAASAIPVAIFERVIWSVTSAARAARGSSSSEVKTLASFCFFEFHESLLGERMCGALDALDPPPGEERMGRLARAALLPVALPIAIVGMTLLLALDSCVAIYRVLTNRPYRGRTSPWAAIAEFWRELRTQ